MEDFDPSQIPEDERAEMAVQIPVISAARSFLELFYVAGDLAAAWPSVDPLLRLCWAQWWLEANASSLTADGYGAEEVAQAFVAQADSHPLWKHFARVLLRDFRASFPLNPDTWAFGYSPRVLTLDTEVLYVHREQPEGGVWQPGATNEVVPLVMRLNGEHWRVLNLGYERIPSPGWPPALS